MATYSLSWAIGRALARSGVRPGDKVAVLSANDPVAFCCVFGIARAGAVWCPVNPRNEAAENRELLDLFDCSCLGKLLPAGQRGEIVVRGPLVMAGYYQDPAATAEASRHGWHHTGDIGYLDPGNYLYIVDRAKDMIITGGFNVYSAEVEQALLAHPAVLDCAVIGLPDDKWGERVTAIIQPHPGQDVTDQDIRAFVKARLGSVKTPKQVEMWTDLPRSKLGKILKNEVKSQLLSQADDDRH
ncbi:MAG TPA: AMP-binding protein [Streptosporangiaceae bacterium]|nr:AMP-binding protein [Streptosporangiaceae bacterium]HYA51466.1 AMP-binding protein [Streptosporangiaceae bacterium]